MVEGKLLYFFPIVPPVIPFVLIEVRYVTLFTCQSGIWTGAMQTKKVFSCKVIDACTMLNTLIPEGKGALSLLHVFAHCLLDCSTMKLIFIIPMSIISNTLRLVPISLQNFSCLQTFLLWSHRRE